ncbi:MAG: hypothetical protein IJW72_06340 [Alphaproteobacteria bacterium]|nr:hypothetical protein [Alphaproteobacteria bacterium]MBQ7285851.1 hypothetical protein [Alphaproteobacteria bacterium]
MDEKETKFAKEREKILQEISKGIDSNIPLSAVQNKYVKNLLLFALMNASVNETVTNKNFLKLVNRMFKGYLLKIIKQILDDDDGDFDEALNVDLNKIQADKKVINVEKLANDLSPTQIITFIKNNTNGMTQKQLLKKMLTLRDMKINHRETPEEQREREQRQKEYELTRKRERMMIRGYERERSRS